MMKIGNFLLIISLVGGMCFLSGCASRRELVLSRLLKGIESQESVEYTGPDAPEVPALVLPPPPAESQVGRGGITIQPDCIVQIRVEEDRGLDGSYPVNEVGAVDLGYVGPVFLYNMSEKQAARKIREVLENRYFRKANVRVKILRASYDRVRVDGAVNKPGLISIGAGDVISLNDALLRAGGLRPAVRGAKVRVVRGGLLSAVASSLDGKEYSLVTEDGKADVPDVTLRNNDIVTVFASSAEAAVEIGEKEILVLGEVQRQGIYRFSGAEPCTMMHLILKMGGLPPYANKKAIRIIRRDEEGNEEEIRVNAEKILDDGNPEDDVLLENGDRIIVPARRLSLF